jgi:hypothetical protein
VAAALRHGQNRQNALLGDLAAFLASPSLFIFIPNHPSLSIQMSSSNSSNASVSTLLEKMKHYDKVGALLVESFFSNDLSTFFHFT